MAIQDSEPVIIKGSEQTYSSNQEKKAWSAIWCFMLIVGVPLAIGIGTPLIPIFPAAALALGLYLYYQAPHLYIGFVWWMFFLSNLIRRLIDQRSGYLTPGPWGIVGALVASISLITVFQYLPIAHRKAGLPFTLSLIGIGYAFMAGFIQNSLEVVILNMLSWLCPVAFGFHIFMQWQDYLRIRDILIKTFLWGILFMGVYGIIQYVFVPPWEQFFLNNTGATSFGKPEPFQIRVFSSLGSPQSFAVIMLTGLIVILCQTTNPISYAASGLGYITLILSMARAVWGSAGISIPLFLLSLKPSYQIRMILVMTTIVTIVAMALLSWEPVYNEFYARFETFLNLQDDNSFNGRSEGYQVLWGIAITEFLGRGFGFTFRELDLDISLAGNDGSLFPLLFTFGWFGLIFYMGGFLMLLAKFLQIPNARSDIFLSACRMTVICVLVQSPLNSVFIGPMGMVIWSFSAIGLAGHKYYLYQKQQSTVSNHILRNHSY